MSVLTIAVGGVFSHKAALPEHLNPLVIQSVQVQYPFLKCFAKAISMANPHSMRPPDDSPQTSENK